MSEKMRLDKLLSNMGMGSRNEMRDALKYGWVKVNGVVVKNGQDRIDVEKDEVLYQGQRIIYNKYTYLMLNKPQNVISATEDKRAKTVIDLLEPPYSKMDLFPVGRLDIDTVGLLLLTNDGGLAHDLLSPKKHVNKQYYAVVDGVVTQDDIQAFEQGIPLDDGYVCKPAKLEIINTSDLRSEVFVTISEGKFHQIKRMMAHVGKIVVELKRLRMGSLCLDENLPLGAYRPLTEEELCSLKK